MRIFLAALAIAAATPALADCRDDLTAKFEDLKKQGPYRVDILITKPDHVETTVTEIVPGVGLRMVTDQLGSPMTLIIVGEQGWTSAGDAGYQVLDEKTLRLFESIATVDPMMGTAMENVTCNADGGYTFFIPTLPDPVVVAIDPATGRLAGLTSVLQSDPIDITYTFDPTITVSAPY